MNQNYPPYKVKIDFTLFGMVLVYLNVYFCPSYPISFLCFLFRSYTFIFGNGIFKAAQNSSPKRQMRRTIVTSLIQNIMSNYNEIYHLLMKRNIPATNFRLSPSSKFVSFVKTLHSSSVRIVIVVS